jgi:hypothetical protein
MGCKSRPRRGAGVCVVLLGLCMLVVGCGGGSTSSSKGHSQPGGFAELPTHRCTTSAAIRDFPVTPPPASLKLPIPASLASDLVVYADSAGTILPAPKDWRCQAAIGTDGTENMAVYPGNGVNPLALHPGNASQGVTLTVVTGCQGCVADMVCALFPDAKIVHEYSDINTSCTTPNPAAQELSPISPSTVAFKDPPGVRGQGAPSGGRAPAFGIVKLRDVPYSSSNAEAAQVTCAISTEAGDQCSAITSTALAGVLP